jgi:hypothetical protein
MIRIDRLRIDAGAMSPEEGLRLAELVAAALDGVTLPWHGDIPSLRVTVADGGPPARTAEGIAAAVVRAVVDRAHPGGEVD